MTTVFETEACSRCGGTGQYSFNGEHSRCYKCDGKNGCRALTKRGEAAKEFYLSKLTVIATEIKVGDMIQDSLGTKIRVINIVEKVQNFISNGVPGSVNMITFEGKFNCYGVAETHKIRRLPTVEENEILKAEALEYQATLTKAGKPRK